MNIPRRLWFAETLVGSRRRRVVALYSDLKRVKIAPQLSLRASARCVSYYTPVSTAIRAEIRRHSRLEEIGRRHGDFRSRGDTGLAAPHRTTERPD